MSLNLFLKQSLRNFLSKLMLYLTFTLFLILTISISLGMISFSYGFKNSFDQTIGNHRINALLTFEEFLPEWVEEDTTNVTNFLMKEQKENENGGYLYNFLEKIFETESNKNNYLLNLEKRELERLILGIGCFSGQAQKIEDKDLLEIQILAKYFTKLDLELYNKNVVYLRKNLNENYQTVNLLKAYLLEKIKNNSDWILGGFRNWTSDIKVVDSTNSFFSWEYLRTNPTMGQIHDTTPWTIQSNKTNVQKIWQELDLKGEKFKKYLEEQKIVYIQPSFSHQYHYKIGDILNVRFTTWDHQEHHAESIKLLVAGITTTPDTINLKDGETLFLPFKLVTQISDQYNGKNGQDIIEQIGNRPVPSNRTITFNVASENKHLVQGQKVASDLFSHIFTNLKNPGNPLKNSIEWSKFSSSYAQDFSQIMFLIIAYTIGFLNLFLLFIVFYFITQQVVVLQKQTLFFLKAIGVKNSHLSLLTTFSMLFPMLGAIIFGFFGTLAIQQMMYQIAFKDLAFYLPYFSFNFVYFIALIGVILFSLIVFYLINLVLINSKHLTVEGVTSLKTNTRVFDKAKFILNKTSPKFRIGLSFAFQNIYKNLISYFILSITFSIILFETQFNSSLTNSSYAYEKWNLPYRSVNYAEELNLFSPVKSSKEISDEYIREYEKISSLDGLKSINSELELYKTILDYKNSLDNPKTQFNWKDYFLEQGFIRDTLNSFTDNPEIYNEFINRLKKFLEEEGFNDPDMISGIVNLIDQVINKYKVFRDQYNYQDGFTILMGKIFAPPKNRAIFAAHSWYLKENMIIKTLAFEKDDSKTKNYFGFKDLSNDLEDFLVTDSYQKFNFNSHQLITKKRKLLRVNISSYLQSIANLHHGDVLEIEIEGLKSTANIRASKVYAYVDQIVTSNTIDSTVYTSQVGLIKYLIECLNEELSMPNKLSIVDENLFTQKDVYQKLLEDLIKSVNPDTLSNSVFDQDSLVPLGLRYITIPIFSHTDQNKIIGTRIEDFYDKVELNEYLNNLGNQIMIFNQVTKSLLAKGQPFNQILQNFVWILLVISFVISIILIVLMLLENQKVILLFKAMGYQKSEINWYLISGYFFSSLLATITGIGLAIGILSVTNQVLNEYLALIITPIWRWDFIALCLSLPLVFCCLISILIIFYTNIQKPREAFAIY